MKFNEKQPLPQPLPVHGEGRNRWDADERPPLSLSPEAIEACIDPHGEFAPDERPALALTARGYAALEGRQV